MKIKLLLLLIISTISSCSFFNNDLISPLDEYTRNGLSVFYIHPKPISKDFYSPVTVIYKGETYEAEGKIRGGLSALFPKKSYTLRFPDNHLFTEPDYPVFTNRKKIALLAGFDDNSHIRNRLAYWLWNQMDNSFKIDTYSCEVYTNGAYEGLYTVVDFIDESFIERNSLTNGVISGGDLFKGTTNEVDFYMKSNLLTGFEKKGGDPIAGEEGAYDDLAEFITSINNSSEADFATDFGTIANVESYYDWWFFISFMEGWDSAGKNSYHYLDPSTGGKWHYIPWDFNQSFGQSWNTKRVENIFNPSNVSQNGIFNRLIQNPTFSGTYDTEYTNLLLNNLQLSNLLGEVDRLHAKINMAAEQDCNKWGETYKNYYLWKDRKDFTSVDEEIQYIKSWITVQHALFLDIYN